MGEDSMKMNRDILKGIAFVNQIGITMMIPIIGCIFLGIFLDKKLGTTPWLLLVFMFIGMGVAFRNLYMLTKSFSESKKKRP